MQKIGIKATFLVFGVALALTGCGKKSSYSHTTLSSSAGTVTTVSVSSTTLSTNTSKAAVNVGSTKLGNVLVDSNGMTLYLYDKDTATKSNCTGACASSWPPLATGSTAGPGLDKGKITTISRSDGSSQVAYNGHPLYTWQGDHASGDTTGQGVNDFYVVNTSGSKIDNS